MSDANTGQTVECPICETTFDPTVAGGWCTNTDCGEWQYTDDGDGESAESDDSEPADAGADEMDFVDESAADSGEDTGRSEPEPETAEQEPEPEPENDEADTEDIAAETEPADEAETADSEPSEADAEPVADEPSTIDCPDCGSTLDAEVNFCPDCGADVQDIDPAGPLTACPSCDADVDPEDNFCVNCGEDLAAHRDGRADDSEDTASTDTDESAETASSDDVDAAAATSSDDTGAEDAVDALESADETPVPDSLVLDVVGRDIAVDDGDKVGREIRAALIDAGRPEDEAVRIHREHIRFVREDDSFYLLDLGDNPTELNGQTLQKGDREPVEPGDEIELSGVATVSVRAP